MIVKVTAMRTTSYAIFGSGGTGTRVQISKAKLCLEPVLDTQTLQERETCRMWVQRTSWGDLHMISQFN